MYSVILLAAFSAAPEVPDCHARAARRVSAGCVGTVSAKAQGCTSQVQYVAVPVAQGCSGSAHAFRTPVRTLLHRAAAPRGVTTYYPASAVAVVAPTAKQSVQPPVAVAPIAFSATPVRVYRAPVRSFVCPGPNCPR